MNILLLLVISLIALFTLSLLARRSETVAGRLAWLASPLRIFGWACLQGSLSCRKHLENTLAWPPQANVIARVVYLALALCVYTGDFVLSRLRSAAFFGVHAEKLPWLPLDNFSGLLWLCISALWGILLFDCIGLTPPGWRLLPVERLNKFVRFCMTLLALGLFVVSALTMAYFVQWGQMQISDQVSFDTVLLGLNISLVFGALLGLASAVALWALFVGIAGVYSIGVALLYCVLCILALGLRVLSHSLNTCGDAYPEPIPAPFYQISQHHPTASQLQTGGSVAGYLPAATNESIPIHMEDPMAERLRQQIVTRIQLGSFGYRFSSPFAIACEEIGAHRLTRLHTVVDLSRPKGRGSRTNSTSGKDITPHDYINNLVASGTPLEQAYAGVMNTIVNSTVDSFTAAPVIKGYIVIAVDLPLLPYISEPLQNLHRRLSSHPILLLSSLSDRVLQDKNIDEAFKTLHYLCETEVVQNALLVHSRSPLANRIGEETQEKFLAKALASLLVGHEHSDYNPTFGEVFEECRSFSPCTVLSFASAKVSAGKATAGQHMVNTLQPKAPAVGKGDVQDCISQTMNLFQAVCEPRSLAITEQGTIGEPLFFLVNVPIPLSDQRFEEYVGTVKPQLVHTHPQAKLIIVRGGGTPESKDNPGYHAQCSALHPLFLTSTEAAENEANAPLTVEIPTVEVSALRVNDRRKQQSIIS